MKLFKNPIFWVLLLALALRLGGVTYGFPLFLVKDEPTLVYGALKMVELKTLVPAFHEEEFKKVLYYPPAPSYFYLITLAPVIGIHYFASGLPPLGEYKNLLALDPSFIWITARIITIFLGVLNIFIIYLIAKKIFKSELAGLFAALFLALSFYHLQLSEVVRHWLPATVLIYAVWLLSAKIIEGGAGFKTYLLAGVLLGISAGGVNTASVIAALPLVLAHLFQPSQGSFWKKIIDKRLIVAVLVFISVALLFVALYPYGFSRAEGAPDPAADVARRFSGLSEKSFAGWASFLGFYLKLLWRYEATLFVVALAGAVLLLLRKSWRWVFAGAVFVFVYFTLLYLFFNPIPRGLIFVLPILAVFAGFAADTIFKRLSAAFASKSPILLSTFYFLFSVALFGWPFVADLRYAWLIMQNDTRIAARDWVFQNIPENTKVLVDSQYLRFINAKEGIYELRRIDPAGLRTADFVLERISDERYPRPAHHILNLHFVSKELPERNISDPEFFRKQGFRYFIVEYDYTDGRDLAPQSKALIEKARLVERFDNLAGTGFKTALDAGGEIATVSLLDLFKIRRLGKYVDIYEF